MYNANKIIKVYKDELIKIKYYNVVDEPLEFYHKFKAIAGRSLRLYLDKAIISPIEMLAILGKDGEVKKLFKVCIDNKLISDKVIKNLTKIYTINKQVAKPNKNKISISPKRFTKKEKLFYRVGLASSFVFMLVICSVLVFLNSTIGFGTSLNPYKIYNQTQLINALKTNGYYTLCNDIEISKELDDISFSGNFEGNNHTLTIKYLPSSSLLAQNDGTIRNLAINYSEHTGNVYENLSLLVGTNNGTINNVDIIASSLVLTCNKGGNDIYVSAYANTNNGTITNCDLSLSTTITSSGNGECYTSGFVGINNGTIEKCNFTSGSLSTSEADVSGICITNEVSGIIKDVKTYANVSQSSALDSWSPNVSGVAMTNYGTIENCFNFGTITATSTNNTDDAQGVILIGGISSNNYGLIQKCLNKGTINATSQKLIIYAGGICGFSDYWENNGNIIYPGIINCGSQGEINVSSEDEKAFVLAGGISGFLCGEIVNCYSLSTISTAYDDDKNFIGSLLGSASINYFEYVIITSSNNYVIEQDNTPHHIGTLVYRYQDATGMHTSIVYVGENITGISVASESTIKQKEIYFDEQA